MTESTAADTLVSKRKLIKGPEIERFTTQTEIIERFSDLTKLPALCIERGSDEFFREFRDYISPDRKIERSSFVGIPSDPTDFLAFSCGLDELRLALSRNHEPSEVNQRLEGLKSRYGLEEEALLRQPIRTLSGGERSLVALAKADALEQCATGLVLASPVTWLHESRRHLVMQLCRYYMDRGKPAHILLLDGDWPELAGNVSSSWKPVSVEGVAWSLGINGVTVTFPAQSFPNKTPQRVIRYTHENERLALTSPTLVQGDNGVGKSTLALVLAGVVEPSAGEPRLQSAGLRGSARLLLQDTIRQMFAMSSGQHIQSVFRYDKERRKFAQKLFEEVQEKTAKEIKVAHAIGTRDQSGRPSSLFHDKVALAIERIVAGTNLLILDEPCWGLCEAYARELVSCIIQEAHKREIPVAIISHDRGWIQEICQSRLLLEQGSGSVEVKLYAD